MRRLLAIALALAMPCARADSPALTLTQQRIASPAPVGAASPRFLETEGAVSLAWLEPSAGHAARVCSAAWSSDAGGWSAPQAAPSLTAETFDPPPARVHFPDGSSLSAFFPEAGGRILDLHTQRHHDGSAAPPRALTSESWPAGGSPPEPPLLAAREARVIAVWLTHAGKSPRLLAALSTNAGALFFLPLQIDDGRPLGRADLVMLRDGSVYITWLEAERLEKNTAALWLRRVSPGGALSVPVRLATGVSATPAGRPRVALLKDYDTAPAQLLVAHTQETDGIRQIVTQLLTLPPAESFSRDRGCLSCPADDIARPGHPLLGKITRLLPESSEVIVAHAEIPGILPAGDTRFRCDETTWPALRGITRLSARIEKRGGHWWLFDIHALLTPGHP
jgi:hypothetical protein